MSPIPTTVKVGYRDYAIIDWNPAHAARASRYGECVHPEREIRVSTEHGYREAAQTLLHEIYHAIFASFPVYEQDAEERIVTGLSACFAAVWRDNPGVIAWINEGLTAQ